MNNAHHMKKIFADAAFINTPLGGLLAAINISEMKDLAILASALITAACTLAITIWRIKKGKKEE